MRKSAVWMAVGTVVAGLGFARPALPWGSAVHAYVDAQLGYEGVVEKNVIYGAMAADTFNFLFEKPNQMRWLYGMTHGLTPYGLATVLPVWQLAGTERERAVALGYFSHNNVNGADVTAHGSPYNDPDAYIIKKAVLLQDILEPYLEGAGLDLDDDVLLEVCHVVVEYSTELLIRKADRSIGAKVLSAAAVRDEAFPRLLADAYADPFAATFGVAPAAARDLIATQEETFRQMMIEYGKILQYGDQKAQEEVAEFLAGVAAKYLASFGVVLPEEAALPLIKVGLAAGMGLCEADLMAAVQETVEVTEEAVAGLP